MVIRHAKSSRKSGDLPLFRLFSHLSPVLRKISHKNGRFVQNLGKNGMEVNYDHFSESNLMKNIKMFSDLFMYVFIVLMT